MQHDDDVRTARERGPVTGLLVSTVAAVFGMNDEGNAEPFGDLYRPVDGAVVDEQELVHEARRHLVHGFLKGPLGVVRRKDGDESLAADQGFSSRNLDSLGK